MRHTLFLALALLTAACSMEGTLLVDGDGHVSSPFDGASLRILQPQSGAILLKEDSPYDLEALVSLADGSPHETAEIRWSTDRDEEWGIRGSALQVGLPLGLQNLTAETLLPNGDRLAHSQGGIRVQSQYTGIYTGSLRIRVQTDQGISGSCIGPLSFQVGLEGETFEGPSQCSLDLGFAIDIDMSVYGDIFDGDVEGTVGVSVGGFFEIPVAYEGSYVDEDSIEAFFAFELMGYPVDGTLLAQRITRLIED